MKRFPAGRPRLFSSTFGQRAQQNNRSQTRRKTMNGFAGKAKNTTQIGVPIIPLFVLSFFAVSLVAVADVPKTLESDDSTAPTRTGDWTQEGFDSGHTSFNRFETELGPENVGNLVELWESPVDVGSLFCGP